MKSIRMKIVACMLIAILTSLVIVGGISAWLNYTSTIDTLGQTMTEMADTAAERIEEELNAYKNIAYVTGCIPTLSDRTQWRKNGLLLRTRPFPTDFKEVI